MYATHARYAGVTFAAARRHAQGGVKLRPGKHVCVAFLEVSILQEQFLRRADS